MSYILTKLLPLFIYPLGVSICLSLFALFFILAGGKQRAGGCIVLTIVVLWSASTSVVADFVMASLEQRYPPVASKNMVSADAILILGGVTRGTVAGTGMTDLDGGVDRLIYGARLFEAGKAPRVVLTGGNAEGYQPESEAMADVLKLMGVPKSAMILESTSRTTYQNGVNTVPILKQQAIHTVLLVTSAYHMRRAVMVFEKLGVTVIPAATDYQIVERSRTILDWLPQAGALSTTSQGIKEYIGLLVYSFKL